MAMKCSICKGDHNLTGHFRLVRDDIEKRVVLASVIPPDVTNVTNDVINASKSVINGSNDRRVKWQKAHREEYNAKMREYRRCKNA